MLRGSWVVVAGLCALVAAEPSRAMAADFTWDGGSAVNNNWTAPENWNPDGAPASNGTASLIFDGLVRTAPTNDFTAATAFTDLSFATTAGAFVLSGNSITLSGNITDSTASTTQAVNLDVALTSAAHTINVASTGTLSIGGVLSGSGAAVSKTGFGTLALSRANSYTGPTTVHNGTLLLDFADPLAPTSQILYSGVGSGRNLTLGKTAVSAGSDNFISGYAALVANGSTAGSATPVSQTFDSTTFGFGVSRVSATKGTDPGSSTTVDLGAITHTLAGTTYFLLPTKSAGSTSTTAGNPGILISPTLTVTAGTVHTTSTNSNGTTGAANGILGGWAYIADTLMGFRSGNAAGSFEVSPGSGVLAATEFASVDASGNIVPFTGYTNLGPTNGTGSNLKITSNPNSVVDFKILYSDARGTAQFLANTIANGQITVQFQAGTDTSMIQVGQFFSSGPLLGSAGANSGLLWSSVAAIDSPTQIRLQPFPTGATGSAGVSQAWSIYSSNVQQLEMATAGLTDINSIRIGEGSGRWIDIGTGNTLRLGKSGAVFKEGFGASNVFVLLGTQAAGIPGTGIQDRGTLTAGGPDVGGVAQAGELTFNLVGPNTVNGRVNVDARITDNPGDDNNPNAGGPNGTVTVVKSGPSPLALRGLNTYSGGTYILEGRVQLAGAETKLADGVTNGLGNPGGFGTGPVYILPGGQWFASGLANGIQFTNNVFLAGTGTFGEQLGAIRFGAGTYTGTFTLIGDTRLGAGNNQTIITGQITGSHNLELGLLFTLNTELQLANPNSSGPNANNWTGSTTIQGRNGGTGLVHLGANEQIPNGVSFGNLIMRGGQNLTNDAILDLAGRTEAVNGLVGTTNADRTRIENRTGSTTATLIVGDADASSTFNGKIVDGNNGTGSGQVALTKIGAGTLRAGGSLIYTGTTTINSGTLQLDATQSLKKVKLNGATAALALNTATANTKSFEATAAGGTINHAGNAFSVIGGAGESVTWNSGAQLHVQGSSGGKLVLNAAAGTSVSVADNTALITVHPGATLELAGLSATSSGSNFVNIQNDSLTSLHVTGANQAVGNLDGAGNTTVDANQSLTAGRIVQNQLTISGDAGNSSASVTIRRSGVPSPNPQGSDAQLSILNSLSLANDGAAITAPPPGGFSAPIRQYFGMLDLQNNDLIITAGSTALFAEVQDMIRAGVFSNGTRGINSHEALFTGPFAGATWLGSIYNGFDDDSNPNTPEVPLLTSFDGVPLVGGEILIKYTWFGDADLDGLVTGLDFGLLLAGLGGSDPNQASNPWLFGDFDYNGIVDSLDYGLLLAGTSGGGDSTHLPEPDSLLLMAAGVALVALLRRPLRNRLRGRH